jgi:excinuclease ABC subunit A
MRLLWARIGIAYSPATGLPIESQTVSQMVDRVLALPEGTRLYLLAPVVRPQGRVPQGTGGVSQEGVPARQIDGVSRRRCARAGQSSATTSTWWWTA